MIVWPVSGLEELIAVVVPTYWTHPGGAARPGDAVYDHPTPLDDEGTLGRLLDSLVLLDGNRFYLVIVVAVTNPELGAEASAVVRRVAARRPGLRVLVVDDQLLARVAPRIPAGAGAALIGLREYSLVRNLQLLAPLALDASAIVAVDDDEVITDPDFLEQATSSLNGIIDGRRVDGLAGYYLQDRSGRIMLEVPADQADPLNVFDRKAVIMNEATRRLEAVAGQIVPTPFCFGGNMVFTPRLAASVCFDPAITRGEDIDYLINARLAGHWFFMNKALRILHLPPAGGSYHDVAYHKIVQDVLRFVYERAKLRAWREIDAVEPLTLDDLDPYPGLFLREDLDRSALEIVNRIVEETNGEQRETLGLPVSATEFMRQAEDRARQGVASYRRHQEAWGSLVSAVKEDSSLVALMAGEVTAGPQAARA